MYYLLMTGRIVTERDMRTAYEIAFGGDANVHKTHYEKWVKSVKGIRATMSKSEITIEQLIKGNCIVEAVRIYKDQHDCTLREAKYAVDKIKAEMED